MVNRVFGDLGIGVGVAADHAPVIGELTAQVHFQATGTHFASGTVNRGRAFGVGHQYIAFLDVEQRDVAGDAARQIELGTQLPGLGFFRRHTAVKHGTAPAQWRDGRVGFE
ncbi:hypothetical protein D3C76_1499800 [compost metagenome]